jgi:2-phospho-L-lactate guanylyltransferase (CobY/MobA/RfbA family)
MVVLGVDVTKEDLLEIAKKANAEAKDTPASNVINVKFGDGSFARFTQTAYKEGYRVSSGQYGRVIVGRK